METEENINNIEEEVLESQEAIQKEGNEDIQEENNEELDKIADTSIEVLQKILSYFEFKETVIDEYEGDEGELILDITGDDLAILIGRHGKNLDALQFLVSTITTHKIGYHFPIVIDITGYKQRQREKLEHIASSSAQKAINQNRSIKLHPMNPYERRIVHLSLQNNSKVITESEGEEPYRRVVIKPC